MEAKRSMGIFSLVGERTAPVAFVTAALALVVRSPIGLREW